MQFLVQSRPQTYIALINTLHKLLMIQFHADNDKIVKRILEIIGNLVEGLGASATPEIIAVWDTKKITDLVDISRKCASQKSASPVSDAEAKIVKRQEAIAGHLIRLFYNLTFIGQMDTSQKIGLLLMTTQSLNWQKRDFSCRCSMCKGFKECWEHCLTLWSPQARDTIANNPEICQFLLLSLDRCMNNQQDTGADILQILQTLHGLTFTKEGRENFPVAGVDKILRVLLVNAGHLEGLTEGTEESNSLHAAFSLLHVLVQDTRLRDAVMKQKQQWSFVIKKMISSIQTQLESSNKKQVVAGSATSKKKKPKKHQMEEHTPLNKVYSGLLLLLDIMFITRDEVENTWELVSTVVTAIDANREIIHDSPDFVISAFRFLSDFKLPEDSENQSDDESKERKIAGLVHIIQSVSRLSSCANLKHYAKILAARYSSLISPTAVTSHDVDNNQTNTDSSVDSGTGYVPDLEELLKAITDILEENPDFGVGRIEKELHTRRPDWLLGKKRVATVMRKHGMTK